MFDSERELTGDQSPNKIIWVVVGVLAVIIVAGLFYLRGRASASGPTEAPHLANAIRPGSPDWDKFHDKIVLDKPDADEKKNALGSWSMGLTTTVRNFTGKTITGLEMRGVVVDLDNRPVKDKTVIEIPNQHAPLEPNKDVLVDVQVEGMKDSDVRANIQMEVTGFTLK